MDSIWPTWTAWQVLCIILPDFQRSFRGRALKGRSYDDGLAKFVEVVRRERLDTSEWLASEGQGLKMPDCEGQACQLEDWEIARGKVASWMTGRFRIARGRLASWRTERFRIARGKVASWRTGKCRISRGMVASRRTGKLREARLLVGGLGYAGLREAGLSAGGREDAGLRKAGLLVATLRGDGRIRRQCLDSPGRSGR